MSVSPLVSVLMTAYNRELYVAEAIESVLASTYKNIELIIVDDCSKDKTVEIIQAYVAKDSRIRFFQNEINLKDYPNRNRAASYAVGEYIMNVDSDDTIYPDSISYCMNEMLKNTNADFGIVCHNKDLFNRVLSSKEAIEYHFFTKPFLTIGPGGTILKRIFFEKLNYYPVKYGPANDMYFNIKAAANGNVVILNREIVYYRIHDGQEQNNKYAYLYNGYNYLRDAIAELPLPLKVSEKKWILKKNKRRFLTNIISYYIGTFDFKKTIAALRATNFSFRNAIEGLFQV
jgi:glycosyltransferase involved in cell wall biosynthesis